MRLEAASSLIKPVDNFAVVKPTVQIIGVPSDLGANMRGANMGPAAIRIADLHQKIHVLGYEIMDIGDLAVPVRDTLPEDAAKNHFLPQLAKLCDDVQRAVYSALTAKRLPIVIG